MISLAEHALGEVEPFGGARACGELQPSGRASPPIRVARGAGSLRAARGPAPPASGTP